MNMAAPTRDIKSKPLAVSEKLNTIKCAIVRNIPRNKITEELGIPVRKVTAKMHRWSDTGENVMTFTHLGLLQITEIQHKQAKKYRTFQS
jgi:hypothetical protein